MGPDMADDATIEFSLSRQLLEQVQMAAEKRGHSLSEEICERLDNSFSAPRVPASLRKKVMEYQSKMPVRLLSPHPDNSFEGTLGYLIMSGFKYLADADRNYNASLEVENLSLQLLLEHLENDQSKGGEEPDLGFEDLIRKLDYIYSNLDEITDVMLEEGRRLQSAHELLVGMKRRMHQLGVKVMADLEHDRTHDGSSGP